VAPTDPNERIPLLTDGGCISQEVASVGTVSVGKRLSGL
jgi:hypothetical protein